MVDSYSLTVSLNCVDEDNNNNAPQIILDLYAHGKF